MNKERLLWCLGVVLVLAVGFGYGYQRNLRQRYIEYQSKKDDLKTMQQEVDSLRQKVEETRAGIATLENNPVETEARARKDAGMTRPGEIVFKIERSSTGEVTGVEADGGGDGEKLPAED